MKNITLFLIFIEICLINMANGRIVGGFDSPTGTAVYQASIRRNNRHICGGSIISTRWILTVGHCGVVLTTANTTVVVGTDLLDSGGWEYSLENIIVHEEFNKSTIFNDIAMLKTTDHIVYNSLVGRIYLPLYETLPGSVLSLTGWGRLIAGGTVPNALQKIRLTTIDIAECKIKSGVSTRIWEKHICTFNKIGEGACNGDSGGPLVDDFGVLVAIVSWGFACAVGKPDIHTNVYSYYNWIMNTAAAN